MAAGCHRSHTAAGVVIGVGGHQGYFRGYFASVATDGQSYFGSVAAGVVIGVRGSYSPV